MMSVENTNTVSNGDALRQLAKYLLNDSNKQVKKEQQEQEQQDSKLVQSTLSTTATIEPPFVSASPVLQAHEQSHTTPRNFGKISFSRKKQCFELHCLDESGVRMNGVYFGQYSHVPLLQECELQLGQYITLTFAPPTVMDMKVQTTPSRVASFSSLPDAEATETKSKKRKRSPPVVQEQQQEEDEDDDAVEQDSQQDASEQEDDDDESVATYGPVTLDNPEQDLQERPFETYQEMITECLRAQPTHTCSLQGIYQWMSETYAVFANVKRDWHASVRTYLCKSSRFYRVQGNYKPAVYGLKQEYIVKDTTSRPKKKRKIRHSTSTSTDALLEQ